MKVSPMIQRRSSGKPQKVATDPTLPKIALALWRFELRVTAAVRQTKATKFATKTLSYRILLLTPDDGPLKLKAATAADVCSTTLK